MIPYLAYRGSRPGLFYNLSAGEFCPLRIPLDKLGAAVSPTDKSGKGRRPPARHFRKGIITLNAHTVFIKLSAFGIWHSEIRVP
jgi:hypothetical protein